MTGHVAHRRTPVAVSCWCTRCLGVIQAPAGTWLAVEPEAVAPAPVCDDCARRDDPEGFEMVAGFRRMASRAA